MAAVNVYQMVTDRIIEQLEQGVVPWRKTWQGSVPINYVSRKPYRGVNTLLLQQGGEYLTFLQCKQAGGHVKKGEHGSIIVFYKPIEVDKDKDTDDQKIIPFLKYSTVFHISQCEGITSKLTQTAPSEVEPIQAAQGIIDDYQQRSGVNIDTVQGSDRAYYQPSSDTIVLPAITQFASAAEYYSVAFHESAHSTGHSSRLNREIGQAAFGSQSYSREELIAEISAAMCMNDARLEMPDTFQNSAAYIAGWLKRLREDNKAIVQASSAAQKAVDLILNKTDTSEASE